MSMMFKPAGRGPASLAVGSQTATPGRAPATSQSIKPTPFTDEGQFRVRLGRALQSLGHRVYLHDPDDRDQFPAFSVRKVRVYPDIYVITSPEWRHHEIFPAIAIETKLGKGLNWAVRHALKQVAKYSAASGAVHEIGGKVVPAPSIILLATPSSVSRHRVLYWWSNPKYRTQDQQWAASDAITELMQRQLQDVGGAIMIGRGFQSNIIDASGTKGAMTRYELTA